MMRYHVSKAAARIGEPMGIITSRKVMAAYVRHLPKARELRGALMQCERLADVDAVLGPLGVAGNDYGRAEIEERKIG
jgi:tRNA-dihydrouridine synthase